MQITALVPIKSFSSRLPNKNFLEIGGLPLFHHVLGTLSGISNIDKIIVNTDSDKVIEDCTKFFPKVKIHLRPDHLSSGEINGNELIHYDLSLDTAEYYLQTHCTNPLLSKSTIHAAILKYFNHQAEFDSLISVDVCRKRIYDKYSKAINHDVSRMQQTQDLDPVFIENSNVFIFSRKSFYDNNNSRVGKNSQLLPMSYIEGLDIDYEEDYELAKLIFNHKEKFQSLFKD